MRLNKKAETGVDETGSELINIIISIIVLIFIAYLIYVIYNFYTQKENVSRANSELNEILLALKSTYERGGVSEYIPTYAPEWFLFSTEFPDLCDPGPYCLCLCLEKVCQNQRARACIATDKFVVLRGITPSTGKFQEQRTLVLESLTASKFSSIKETAIPFSGASNSVEYGWSGIGTPIPLYYKFAGGKWFWSPDLENWYETSTKTATEGRWAGQTSTANALFLDSIQLSIQHSQNPESDVKERFRNLHATESKDFYLIEQGGP